MCVSLSLYGILVGRLSFSFLLRLTIIRHAKARIRSDVVLDVALSHQHAGVHVMTGTMVIARTLAQRIGVHLVQELLTLAHREQFAGLLALAAQALFKTKEYRFTFWMDCVILFKLTLCGEQANR